MLQTTRATSVRRLFVLLCGFEIKTIATEERALLLLFHDPAEIQRIRLSPLCYA